MKLRLQNHQNQLLQEFYGPFAETLSHAEEVIGQVELSVVLSDIPCEIED